MNQILAKIRKAVPSVCRTSMCDKDGCSVSMKGAPRPHVIIDMDCKKLGIRGSRCDYLFISKKDQNSAWVVPIELKSGRFDVSKVRDQLQGGARFAQTLLARGDQFDFVPILAHGKPIHRAEMYRLRAVRITFRGKKQQPRLIGCGAPLPVLQPSFRGSGSGRSRPDSTTRRRLPTRFGSKSSI